MIWGEQCGDTPQRVKFPLPTCTPRLVVQKVGTNPSRTQVHYPGWELKVGTKASTTQVPSHTGNAAKSQPGSNVPISMYYFKDYVL